MKLLAKFNLILIVVYGVCGLVIAQISYSYLIGNARREAMEKAELLLASAQSVRDYTADDLSPLLQQNPRYRTHFLAETIPFFGATTAFNRLRKDYPDYAYKEAALNPTNPEDRASDWETDIIQWLRDHPSEAQEIGDRPTPTGVSLYIARPIETTPECLECHSTPAAAPKGMIVAYGQDHGFGWKNHEIVGAQIVSVPLSVPEANANRAFHGLLLFLILTMLLTIAALDAGVFWFVIRPLRRVSDNADRASRGEKNVPSVEVRGKDEIASVAASFSRMQVSLAKALKMLEEK
jgi:protein-histidine pros-kinase